MEELLASYQKKTITLSRGMPVEGEVILKTDQELILELGTKAEGILNRRDLSPEQFAKTQIGDKISSFVAQVENEAGQVVLSSAPVAAKTGREGQFGSKRSNLWNRFIQAKNQGSRLHGKVLEVNKGGLIIETDNIRGFLPNSQVGFELLSKIKQGISDLVSEELTVSVIEVDPNNNRLIFSQRGQLSGEVLDKLTAFKEGDKVTGKVVAVLPFGIVLDVNSVEGLVFASDVSWERVDDLSSLYKVGQVLEAQILGVDNELGRLNLSLKSLQKDPFETLKEKYKSDDLVKGEVLEVSENGVKVKLTEGIEGVIPLAKLGGKTYQIGETVTVLVDNVDTRKRVINLSPMITSTADLIYK